jgi:IS1 family transposase
MCNNCPKCASENSIKNGYTYHKKSRLKCKSCGYQFTLNPTKKYITDSTRDLVRKLLLERIALAGIQRVAEVSKAWLSQFLKAEYAQSPADLNAEQTLPTAPELEIANIEASIKFEKKKLNIDISDIESDANRLFESSEEAFLDELSDWFSIETGLNFLEIEPEFESPLPSELKPKDAGKYLPLMNVVPCEADEVWSFVGSKKEKQWIWLAMNQYNRQIIGFHVGPRTIDSAQKLWESLPELFREGATFCTDFLAAYKRIFTQENHHQGGKDIGFVNHLERFNNTLRQRCSRLVRKTLSFSKNIDLHIGAIRYFICHYNKQVIIT